MVAMLVSLMEGNSNDVHTKFCEDLVQTLQGRHYLPLINNESRLKKRIWHLLCVILWRNI